MSNQTVAPSKGSFDLLKFDPICLATSEQVATPKPATHRDEPPCDCEKCDEETRKADEVRRAILAALDDDALRFVIAEGGPAR